MAHTQPTIITRGRLVALLVMLAFHASGCAVGTFDAQAKREEKRCKDPDTLTDVEPPLEAYEDQGLVLGYDRLVPRPNPRKGVDVDFSKAVFEDPASLEQVYFDASEGNERARWLLCIYEVVARQMGRTAAQHLMSLKCQTIANCRVNFDAVPLSQDTESGIRLLEMMSDSFETTASRLGAEQALLTYGLTLFVGIKMFTAPAAPGVGARSATIPSSSLIVRRGGMAPLRTGLRGEAAVRARYDIGEKYRIYVNGRIRIPDGIKDKVLSEVKNVKKLSYTRQLRDFHDYARAHGFEFHLYIRTDTTVTAPLDVAIKAGAIKLRYIP